MKDFSKVQLAFCQHHDDGETHETVADSLLMETHLSVIEMVVGKDCCQLSKVFRVGVGSSTAVIQLKDVVANGNLFP